jgi:hypothetical protein
MAAKKTSSARASGAAAKRTRAGAAYDEAKQFDGKRYTGMKVGRSHRWKYDAGDWRERKVTPDDWTFTYEVKKRRAGRAPEGSGAPVGTGYHWYVLADQFVEKLDANTYSTAMSGLKVKLAHKRAGSDKWSASDAAQRRHLIAALKQLILRLEGDALVAAAPPAPSASSERAAAANGGGRRARRRPAGAREVAAAHG